MSESKEISKNRFDLTNVISNAIALPGVKVSRVDFLKEQFKEYDENTLALIIEKGPVNAGCTRDELEKKAKRLIKAKTALSAGASFLAGLPGGWTMAATIPADLLQFYGVTLRIAQELIYLYGEEDLWCESTPDYEKIENQLVLYCGVMLGVAGASQLIRLMANALAKQALVQLPKKALTKVAIFTITRSVLKVFGIKVTKSSFAQVVSKSIPVAGGVISGTMTLSSLLPMSNRLRKTLDKAHFDYTLDDYETDYIELQEILKETDEDFEIVLDDGNTFDDEVNDNN